MVVCLLALIIFMSTLIGLPILGALEKGIARKNLFVVILCSLFFPVGLFFSLIIDFPSEDFLSVFTKFIFFLMLAFPLWITAIMIVKYSKSNPEVASKNVQSHRIIRLLIALITILILIFLGYIVFYWRHCMGDICYDYLSY